ncbi:MAG TPA: hypothetical protein VJO16_21960 [Candidatus Acidoferrum sp.]|nr:hypothetical protein [Candidatus Acidoferrum sp.]
MGSGRCRHAPLAFLQEPVGAAQQFVLRVDHYIVAAHDRTLEEGEEGFIQATVLRGLVPQLEANVFRGSRALAARRASQLEPGNLAYFIDIGKALLAAGRIPDARKIAETAHKIATTTGERNMATSFTKQIDYKVNHPQEAVTAKPGDTDSSARDAAATDLTESQVHAEGQITELLCGHPPEVLLTLTMEGNSLLLHVADIARITIQDGAKASDATLLPCAKWKDRRAKIDYRALSSGMAKGEVESISLQ